MKNFFRSSFFAGCFILALAIVSAPLLEAVQRIAPNTSSQAQIDISPSKPLSELFSSLLEKAYAALGSGVLNPACTDNYLSWPSSTTRNESAPWSTAFSMGERLISQGTSLPHTVANFDKDLNGDGLPDYMYNISSLSVSGTGSSAIKYRKVESCVYLSNGSGWEPAYRCVAVLNHPIMTYYGDCAAQ